MNPGGIRGRRRVEPSSREQVGRFDELEIESDLLRHNPLGDPHVRPLWVYMPPRVRRRA
jgi:hypothetical protein